MTTRWTFVRHGESTANASGRLAGHRDVPLTERGEQQALALREALRDLPYTRALVSDLRRALRTLELADPDVDAVVLPGLRERSVGTWELQDRQRLRATGEFHALLDWEGRPPGGESLDDLRHRVLTTLAAHDDGVDTLVVCHGGVMRVVFGTLDGESHDVTARKRFDNCEIEHRTLAVGTWARLAATLRTPRG